MALALVLAGVLAGVQVQAQGLVLGQRRGGVSVRASAWTWA